MDVAAVSTTSPQILPAAQCFLNQGLLDQVYFNAAGRVLATSRQTLLHCTLPIAYSHVYR